MYTEIVSPEMGASRIREAIDPESKHFSDEELKRIVLTCSGMLDRAVVKCLLGLIQKAKDNHDSETVLKTRTFLNRFESGLIPV